MYSAYVPFQSCAERRKVLPQSMLRRVLCKWWRENVSPPSHLFALFSNRRISIASVFLQASPMDVFKRAQFQFQSLPHRLSSAIRSMASERHRPLLNTPSLPRRRRNGISADSYNELRKRHLQASLPTIVLGHEPTREFSLVGVDLPLAASSYYIVTLINRCSTLVLLDQNSELCRIDLSDRLVLVHDLCWSSRLNLFLLAGYSVYTFDPRSYHLSSIDRIEFTRGEWIVSITCDAHAMYLLYSSRFARLERRSLFAPHAIEQQWSHPSFLRHGDFLAQCIRINEWNILAMTIKDQSGHWRVDLFDGFNLRRLHRGHSLGQGVPGMRNCLLTPSNQRWIVINNCILSEQVILLDEQGRVKARTHITKPSGCLNLCSVGNQWIAMTLKDKLRLYQMQ